MAACCRSDEVEAPAQRADLNADAERSALLPSASGWLLMITCSSPHWKHPLPARSITIALLCHRSGRTMMATLWVH